VLFPVPGHAHPRRPADRRAWHQDRLLSANGCSIVPSAANCIRCELATICASSRLSAAIGRLARESGRLVGGDDSCRWDLAARWVVAERRGDGRFIGRLA
jgi:hypothetical protein